MAFIFYKDKQFVSSANIRVFPCAYRGYYNVEGDDITAKVFDPEARATTEANFADTFHKISLNKPSYVVSWAGGILKCVIDGYYFEIKNCELDDFFTTDANNNKVPLALCIQTNEIDLGSSDADSNRQTKILKALTEDAEYLDVQTDGGYIFNGLCLIPNTSVNENEAYKSLVPFRSRDTGKKDAQNKPIYVQELNPAQLAITDLIDTGTGNYSIRLLSDMENNTSTETIYDGDYSVALGKKTKATGNFSAVIGNESEATGESSLAFGEKSKAQGKGSIAGGVAATAAKPSSVALGDHVTTNANHQVVLGKYNQADSTKALIVANGTSASAKYNIFTVSYEGDVAAKGDLNIDGSANIGDDLEVDGTLTLNSTLEAKGSITANGDAANDLILGSDNSGSYGSISVYGEETDKVFEVTKEGNIELAGKAKSSATTSTDIATTLTTKGYVDSLISTSITNGIAGKADSTAVAADLASAIAAAKNELKAYNAEAIEKAVGDAKTELLASISNDFASKSTAGTAPTSSNGNGKYIQKVEQTNGKITATESDFVSSISSTNENDAPTSKAVYDFVTGCVEGIWTTRTVKQSSDKSTLYSLKNIILDATYPVGSIYMCYSDTSLVTCPIKNTLGGTWASIDTGTFLCAASSERSSKYFVGKTGGSANAVIVSHNHSYSNYNSEDGLATTEDGKHSHNVTFYASPTGTGDWEGFEGNAGDDRSDSRKVTEVSTSNGAHTHKVKLPSIASAGEDSTDKNLPPYLAVYMWRRTA